MWRITKRFSFAAAHHLTCVPEGHKCRRVHGHTYNVELELSAATLTNSMVRDYGELAAFGEWIAETLDHRDLNEVLDPRDQPTAERLAFHLYAVASMLWPEVSAVRVEESPTSSAEYRPT